MRKRRCEAPIVAIVDAGAVDNCIQAALDTIECSKIIRTGDRIVITSNMVDAKAAGTGTVVHPDLLRKIIQYVKGFKPSRIVVAAGSGGVPTLQVFDQIGFSKVIQDEKVEFVDLNQGPYTEIQLNHPIVKATKINKLLDEMDVHISFTPIKQHKEATASLGIKNVALSWPPGEIHGIPKKNLGIHEELHKFIVAMGETIPIDITILTGMNGMTGTGPSDGKAVSSNILIAGTDPVSADTVAARLMGFLPQAVQYLFELHRSGAGQADITKVDLRGLPLGQAEEIYSMAAYGQKIAIDGEKILTIHGE